MSERKPHIAVIGGGITGVFAAYFLVRLGAVATIIERVEIGSQASGHNAGGLNPHHGPGIPGPLHELALRSLRLHLEQWEDVRRLSGIDFDGRFVARLHVALDDRETTALAAREQLYNATKGLSARWLSRSELSKIQPRLSPEAVGGLWTDGNARVQPARYTNAVAGAAATLGARTIVTEARGLRHRNGAVTGVVVTSGTVACDGVVIAPGPWFEQPSRWLGADIPIEPLKGELLLVEIGDGALETEITWDRFGIYGGYGRQRWLGGTEDRAGFDLEPTPGARQRILDGIARLVPGLRPQRVLDHVVGLRPVALDGRPIVGIPHGWENVCVAGGAGRKGLLLASGLGLAAAELLVEGTTQMPIGECALGRAGIRR
jgi:glycine/D-amino acid oxidase-like deaminating enzyme